MKPYVSLIKNCYSYMILSPGVHVGPELPWDNTVSPTVPFAAKLRTENSYNIIQNIYLLYECLMHYIYRKIYVDLWISISSI